MSLQKLIEGDCGGANPLMQLGTQFTRDVAHRDDGLVQAHQPNQQINNEFMGQVIGPPTSFRMDTLLQEMREIEQKRTAFMQPAPKVIDEVKLQQQHQQQQQQMVHVQPQQQHNFNVHEFFEDGGVSMPSQRAFMPMPRFMPMAPSFNMPPSILAAPPAPTMLGEQFFAEADSVDKFDTQANEMDTGGFSEEAVSNYNEKFWQRLQDEWAKMSEDSEHPWLAEYNEDYDPYKEYEYAAENPMANVEKALERGKEYLAEGDVPSAVLCFEVASQQQPDNAEVWELLGLSQAENEMDPQAIAALKRAHQLQPDNRKVLMALAVCYTNESLQNQALKMLIGWLDAHPQYKSLLEQHPDLRNFKSPIYSSLASSSRLQTMQELFRTAAALNDKAVDAEVQEALGVLYNLSSDYEQAAESYRAALAVDPQNAKVWNRLGASLANGSRSAEAVQAYQRALQLEPGFIRVRYNVGVCCMNLKAYAQAAEHLITALNMQANAATDNDISEEGAGAGAMNSGQKQMSSTIWSTLKMVLSLMGRNELQGAANEHNLDALNREFNLNQ